MSAECRCRGADHVRSCPFFGMYVVPIIPVDEEAERMVNAMMAKSISNAGRKLVYWPDTLAANLREAGALCRAFGMGIGLGCWASLAADKGGDVPWQPGCKRPAP